MATRYYTSEAYEQIKQTIERIDNDDVNPVVDFIGDLISRIAQHLELFSVDDYQNDMQSWYNIVLDSHNSTIAAVETIFDNVGEVDTAHSQILEDALSSIENFRNSLNCLRDVISGKTSMAAGKSAAVGYLTSGNNALTAARDKIVTRMEQGALWEASKALLGDAIKLGLTSLKCLSGSANIADYKKLADTGFATVCDLFAMASIVLAPLGAIGDSLDGKMDMSYEEYLDVRFMLLSPAKKAKDVNSISDLLGNLAEDMDERLSKCPQDSPMYPVINTIAKASHVTADTYKWVDIAVDAYGVYDDAKDFVGTWAGKDYTVGEFAETFEKQSFSDWKIKSVSDGKSGAILRVKGTPSAVIKKAVSNVFGIPTSGWNDSAGKSMENALKVMGTIWSYGEKLIPDPVSGQSNIDEFPEVFFDKFSDTKFMKDVFDCAQDTTEAVIDFIHDINDGFVHYHDEALYPISRDGDVPEVGIGARDGGKPQCGTASSNWFQCEIGVK